MKKPQSVILDFFDKYRYWIGFTLVMLLAVIFRFWWLSKVPLGLHTGEAAVVSYLGSNNPLGVSVDTLSLGNWYYMLIQSFFVKISAFSLIGLRLLSVIAGILAAYLTYLWLARWHSKRVGLVGGLFTAVTPFAVTVSRIGTSEVLILLLVPLALWLGSKAAERSNHLLYLLLGLTLGALLPQLSDLWVLLLLGIVSLPWIIKSHYASLKAQLLNALVVFGGIAISVLPYFLIAKGNVGNLLLGNKFAHFKDLRLGQYLASVSDNLALFNYRGSEDWLYNLPGLPAFNLFVGVMLALGVLVAFSRFKELKFFLLVLWLAFLVIILPAFGVATENVILFALPFAVALAAIGTSYMLEIWYSTFPINSAARSIGTIPIVLLLVITVYQGYKQYFVAWAGSPEVYQAYDEKAVAAASFLKSNQFAGRRYVLTDDNVDRNTISFMSAYRNDFTFIDFSGLAATNTPTEEPSQFIVVEQKPDATVKKLKELFPKAKLSQHYSRNNDQNELFIIYEVTK